MATETRKDKLLEFYSECQKNGYTDMKDKTQSLKAKVIASDLGLNYSKIGSLYEEAKKVSEEKKQLDSKEGKLVYSCFSSSYNYEKESPILELYICGDNSYFCVVGEKRINGTPTIFTETVVLPKIYTRAPSTTYYGVAYNGMATGTVSHDPGGETMRMEKTEGANVVFKIGEDKYAVKAVKPSPQAYAAFKRDEAFRQFYNGKVLVLDNMNQVTYSGDIYASMRQIALPADEAQKAADLLRRMGSNQLPPTDQELYDKALGLISAKSSAEVQKAIDTFDLISDYKDAPMQKEKAEKRLAEVIQSEKEAAIIKKEKGKKSFILCTIVVLVAAVLMYFLGIPAIKLGNANSLIKSGDYDAAYTILEELGKNDLIIGNKRDRAENLIKSGKYDEAYRLLAEIGDNETILSNKYERALDSIQAGDYEIAYYLLKGLNYKDSETKLAQMKPIYFKMLLQNAKKGSHVFFGTYEQDNKTTNGKEDIEWLVLDKQGNRILVISKYGLDSQPYNNETAWEASTKKYDTGNEDDSYLICWENCSLRKWLNSTFMNAAFSKQEQTMISRTTVRNEQIEIGYHPADQGNDTQDNIFLLSLSEVEKYFQSDKERECSITEYAIAHHKNYTLDGSHRYGDECDWWLRSMGIGGYDSISHGELNKANGNAMYIRTSGLVDKAGYYVFSEDGGVRPAMWIKIG